MPTKFLQETSARRGRTGPAGEPASGCSSRMGCSGAWALSRFCHFNAWLGHRHADRASRRSSHTLVTLPPRVHHKIIQERLGHAKIGFTLDTYSRVVGSLQREAADRLDELLG